MADLALNFGADVYSSDGRRIGSLERVIVEDEGFDPHAVVVKEDSRFAGTFLAPGSMYFHDELIVPVASVRSAGEDRVDLDLTAAEARRLRPYLSYRYRPVDAAAVGRVFAALALPGGVSAPNVDEIAAKGADEIEVAAGENVMLGRTGRRLGHVKEVLVDDGEFVGIVMHPEGFFKHDVVVPVRFLARSDDLALFVDASEADLEHLSAEKS